MTADNHAQSIKPALRLEKRDITIRVVKRDETYYVEYSHLNNRFDDQVDDTLYDGDHWSVFGGSVGYGDSTFEDKDTAVEFYDDLQDLDETEIANKYDDFWVGK